MSSWQHEFFITGILVQKPIYSQRKLNSGIVREGVSFKLEQEYKTIKRTYFLVAYSKTVINLLKDIKKQTYMQVSGSLASRMGGAYLIVTHLQTIKKGSKDLEENDGNKNDSDKLVDGQGVSQD